MKRFRRPLLFAICLLPAGLIGGWFSVQYLFSLLDESAVEEAIRQIGSKEMMTAVTVAQAALYAVVFGFLGCLLAEKIGLMRPFRLQRAETIRIILISVACGAVFSLDAWTFARWIPALRDSYASAGSFDAPTWIASILYGGMIEEVMMRLFVMSLLALLGWKLFCRHSETVPTGVLVGANILSAVAFAAGHLPATAATFGTLTPLLVLRCFLMNGAAGLLFGRLYRKYGIQYAMLAHALFHIVSKTIWLIALP